MHTHQKAFGRALRRHHARRMKACARASRPARAIAGPSPDYAHLRWRDRAGQPHEGVTDWSDVHELRACYEALADHLKNCSCPMCGNPRRHFNEPTLQERRAALRERDQRDECDLLLRQEPGVPEDDIG